jgi:hypothetical protein
VPSSFSASPDHLLEHFVEMRAAEMANSYAMDIRRDDIVLNRSMMKPAFSQR